MCNQNRDTDGWSKAHMKPSAKKISFTTYDFSLEVKTKKISSDVEERKEEEILEFIPSVKLIGLNFSFSSFLIFFVKLFLFHNFLHSTFCIILFSPFLYFETQEGKKRYPTVRDKNQYYFSISVKKMVFQRHIHELYKRQQKTSLLKTYKLLWSTFHVNFSCWHVSFVKATRHV